MSYDELTSNKVFFASFWQRLAAFILDRIVIAIAASLLSIMIPKSILDIDIMEVNQAMQAVVEGMSQGQGSIDSSDAQADSVGSPDAQADNADSFDILTLEHTTIFERWTYFLFIITLFYEVLFWAKFQATLGQMALKIMVVDTSLGKSPLHFLILRALVREFANTFKPLIYVISCLVMLFDKKGQTLHDKICRHYIVRKEHLDAFEAEAEDSYLY